MTAHSNDNLNKPCWKCKRGKYVEKDLLEGLEGILHCSSCDEKIDRRESVVEGFDRYMQGVVDEENRKRSKRELNDDSYGRKLIKKYSELPQNRTVVGKR